MRRLKAYRRADRVRKLCRARGRQHHAGPPGCQFLEGARRVRIRHVAIVPVNPLDDAGDLRVGAARRRECAGLPAFKPILARGLEAFHHRPHPRRVAADGVVQEPLEIGGNLDVHRGGETRGHRRHPVFAGGEKAVQDVVLVGGDSERRDRHSHLLEQPAGQDVAEIAGRDHELDVLPLRRRES